MLAFTVVAGAQKKDSKPVAPVQEQVPPEEDEALVPKEYSFNPLEASRNITAGSEHGIGDWSDAQIKRAITQGIRADGTRLAATMPYAAYAKMRTSDLDAIVAYLRTLKPAGSQ